MLNYTWSKKKTISLNLTSLTGNSLYLKCGWCENSKIQLWYLRQNIFPLFNFLLTNLHFQVYLLPKKVLHFVAQELFLPFTGMAPGISVGIAMSFQLPQNWCLNLNYLRKELYFILRVILGLEGREISHIIQIRICIVASIINISQQNVTIEATLAHFITQSYRLN